MFTENDLFFKIISAFFSFSFSQPWTTYETVGMVTGIASWVCLLVVLCICFVPLLVQNARSRFFSKSFVKLFLNNKNSNSFDRNVSLFFFVLARNIVHFSTILPSFRGFMF